MNHLAPQIYLASTSPRRGQLLQQIGVPFERVRVALEESPRPDENAAECVQRLALEKARDGFKQCYHQRALPVLGADTLIELDGKIMGKPANQAEGLAMLANYSGRMHQVMSAVALVGQVQQQHLERVCLQTSRVWWRTLSSTEMEYYWRSEEPLAKAGGYAIQGVAAIFIERLEGSYSGVMGLPLFETAQLLTTFGISLLPFEDHGRPPNPSDLHK